MFFNRINPIPVPARAFGITSDRTDKIFRALSKAQGQVEKAIRAKTAEDSERRESWAYAGLDDVLDAIQHAAADNGLAVVERFPMGQNSLSVILVHESGQWIDYGEYSLGDYKTHNEKVAAVTYARRVMLKCIYNVADEDSDGIEGGKAIAATPDGAEPTPVARESYQDAKDKYRIEPSVNPAGEMDFDEFATLYERELENAKSINELSMLSKANSKTLNLMERERPDLFKHLQDATHPVTQKLM